MTARATRGITSARSRRLQPHRVLRTWGLYSPAEQVSFESLEGRPPAWQMRGTVMYWVLAPLAVLGAVLLRRRRRVIAPLVATAVTVTIGAALTYGQQRFRVRGGAGDPRARSGAARVHRRPPGETKTVKPSLPSSNRATIRASRGACHPSARSRVATIVTMPSTSSTLATRQSPYVKVPSGVRSLKT